jgi:hypothetical protein
MPRFTIGEFVELNGLLGELHGGTTGTVVSVLPNKQGITALDEYEIAFDDSRQLRLCRFQLTHVVVTDDWRHEKAASLVSQGETNLGRKPT